MIRHELSFDGRIILKREFCVTVLSHHHAFPFQRRVRTIKLKIDQHTITEIYC